MTDPGALADTLGLPETTIRRLISLRGAERAGRESDEDRRLKAARLLARVRAMRVQVIDHAAGRMEDE